MVNCCSGASQVRRCIVECAIRQKDVKPGLAFEHSLVDIIDPTVPFEKSMPLFVNILAQFQKPVLTKSKGYLPRLRLVLSHGNCFR